MRDRIMIAYLAATGALLGFGVEGREGPSNLNLHVYLLVILPFLSLGALLWIGFIAAMTGKQLRERLNGGQS